jgi:hypothetical protein
MSAGVWMAVAARLEWMSDFDALSRVCPDVQRSEQLWKQKHGLVDEWIYNGWSMYRDDQRHGLYLWRYDNGSYASRGIYKNGHRHGLLELWYDNGTLGVRRMYNNGKRHGMYQSWNRDGTPFVWGMYRNGKRHGMYTYSENGQIIRSNIYDDGVRLTVV